MKNLISCGLALSAGAFFVACQPSDSSVDQSTAESSQNTDIQHPNIIHIFADDLGYGDLACFGATDIKTPNIDRMAVEGIKFTDFYSASPVSSPSRAALMTGRYPQRMGIHGVFFPESFTGMPTEEVTIAEMLKTKGYATGIIGKWHLGHMHKYLPLQQGLDYYFGIPYSNDMESVVYMRGNEVVDFHVDQAQTTQTYTREALQFIDKHKDEPFFLYIPHSMPHVPIYASDDFIGTSDRGLYGDVIQELDWSVGQVLKKLEEHQLLENTLIIFSSDNGPWLVMRDHGGSAGPLYQGKQYTFEGGMRVPTVAYWKGTIKAGSEYNDLATQMDWFPTIAKLTGYTIPDSIPIDGEDLTAVLKGTGKRAGDNTFIYYDGSDPRCFRSGQWKVKKPFAGFEGAGWKKPEPPHDTLLIDLKADNGEQNNLYAQQPQKAKELFDAMQKAINDLGELPEGQVIRTPSDHSHYDYLNQRYGAEFYKKK